jgi:hypothetical protein
MGLVAVDFDPFADEPATDQGGARLVPVDFDPFAPSTTVMGEVEEGFKAIPEGAVGMGGQMLKGAAVQQKAMQHNAARLGQAQIGVMDRIDNGEKVPDSEDPIGYQYMEPNSPERAAARQQIQEAIAAFAPGRVQDSYLYGAGESVDEFGKSIAPASPGYEDGPGRTVGAGVGSMLGAAATTVVGGPVVGGALLATAGAGEAAERAIKAKGTEEQIIQAGQAGLVPGGTDLVPVETFLGNIPVPGLKIAANMGGALLKAAGRIGQQALIEGVQEGGQQFLQNLIAKEVHSPDTKLMAEVPENAGVGAVVGGLVETVATPFRKRGGVSAPAAHQQVVTDLNDQRLESPRLTPADRESPLSTALIDDGYAIRDQILAGGGAPPLNEPTKSEEPTKSLSGEAEPLFDEDGQQIGTLTGGQFTPLGQPVVEPPAQAPVVAADSVPESVDVPPPAVVQDVAPTPQDGGQPLAPQPLPTEVAPVAAAVEPADAPTPAVAESAQTQKESPEPEQHAPIVAEDVKFSKSGAPYRTAKSAMLGRPTKEFEPVKIGEGKWGYRAKSQAATTATSTASAATTATAESRVVPGYRISDRIAESEFVGVNAAGESLYDDPSGQRFRVRRDRPSAPQGYRDFGGDLAPVEGTIRPEISSNSSSMEPALTQPEGESGTTQEQKEAVAVATPAVDNSGDKRPRIVDVDSETFAVAGTPYAARKKLKAYGGKWNAESKQWEFYQGKKAEIRAAFSKELGLSDKDLFPTLGRAPDASPADVAEVFKRRIALLSRFEAGHPKDDTLTSEESEWLGQNRFLYGKQGLTIAGKDEIASLRANLPAWEKAAPTKQAAFKEKVAALKKKSADQDAAAAEMAARPGGVVLAQEGHNGRKMGASITPESDGSGQWRITWFDADGFSGHTVVGDKAKAVREALQAGYSDSNPNLLRELSKDERFARGNEAADRIQAENAERAKPKQAALKEKIAKKKQPTSLLAFLALNGGIKPNADLRAIFGRGQKLIPRAGALIRKQGMEPDEARRRAVEAGYLDDTAYEGGTSTSTVNDLYAAIDRENRGSKVFSRRDEADAADGADAKRAADPVAQERDASEALTAHADAIGAAMEPDVEERATQYIMEGSSPAEALERAWTDVIAQNEAIAERIDEMFDGEPIPGWDDEGTNAGPTPEDERSLPGRGDEDARPEEAQAPSQPVEDGGSNREGQGEAATVDEFEVALLNTRNVSAPAAKGPDGRAWRIKQEDGRYIVMRMSNEKGVPPHYFRPEKGERRWNADEAVLKAMEFAKGNVTEIGADGKPQLVLGESFERKDKEDMDRKAVREGAESGLKPKTAQKDVDGLALFGDARNQGEIKFQKAEDEDPRLPEERGRQFSVTDPDGTTFEMGLPDDDKVQPVINAMNEALARMGLPDVKAGVVNDIRITYKDGRKAGAYGLFMNDVIITALDSDHMTWTFTHEFLHAVARLGVFEKSEWAILKSKAERVWMKRYKIVERYPTLSHEQRVEEAIAEALGEHVTRKSIETGTIARIFAKVVRFLEALRSAFLRRGYKTPDDVLEDILSGEITTTRRPRDAQGQFVPYLQATASANGPVMARVNNPGNFGAARPGVVQNLRNHNRTLLANVQAATSWESISESIDRWRVAFQDNVLDLKKVQRAIANLRGAGLSETEDPYLAYTLAESKIGVRLEKLHEKLVVPLMKGIHDRLGKKRVTVDGKTYSGVDLLDLYLYAKHAPERNARIAAINPKIPAGGSGMTDAEAADVIAAVTRAGLVRDLEALRKQVRKLHDFSVQVRLDAGLLSQKQVNDWRATYGDYVPLRGHAELDPELVNERPSFGSGASVRGPESKRALGRESRAADILATSIMQAQEAIIRAERNAVGQALHELAKASPNKDFWEVDKVETKQVWDSRAQQVVRRPVHVLSKRDEALSIFLKIDGKEHRVTFNAENQTAVRLAEAMRNAHGKDLRLMVRFFGQINRYLSMVNTTLNPEFVITNAFRDIQTAGINLQSDESDLAKRATQLYVGAMKASMKGAFGKGSGVWGQWHERFRLAGGETHWNQVDDVATIRRRLDKDIKAMDPSKAMTARRVFVGAKDFIENINKGVENAVRLAVFRAAVEGGASEAYAASAAKNVTVNFNRRGTHGPAMNAAYLFANAGVQGTFTILAAMRSPRVQKVVAGIVAFGAVNALSNLHFGDDDEDGESYYSKIPRHTQERNIIIMWSGSKDKYVAIPMPYGYSVFHTLGRVISEVAFGDKKPLDAAADVVVSFLNSFNPIGGADNIMRVISPTATDPIVDLMTNRDFADRPIMPDEKGVRGSPQPPDAQRYWSTVSPTAKFITDQISSLTGGDKVMPGKVDVSPETLEYLFGVVTGGAGQTIKRAFELPIKLADPEAKVEVNDWPIARKALGSKPGWVDKANFYDRRSEIEQTQKYIKQYRADGQGEKATALQRENAAILRLDKQSDMASNQLSAIRKERVLANDLEERGKITDAEHRKRIEALKLREKAVITRFNKAWVDATR